MENLINNSRNIRSSHPWNGDIIALHSIKAEVSNAPVRLYNFEVVDDQLVFVGNRILIPSE